MGVKLNVLVAAGVLGASVFTGSAAEAYGYAYHGSDWVYVGAMAPYAGYDFVTVRDAEADGHTVYANWYQGPGSGMYTLTNKTGANSSRTTNTSYWVSSFRVCETSVGCSGWKY